MEEIDARAILAQQYRRTARLRALAVLELDAMRSAPVRLDRYAAEVDRLDRQLEGLAWALARAAPPSAPPSWIEGSYRYLLDRLDYRGHYPGKLEALEERGAIRLEAITLPGRKTPRYRMRIVDAAKLDRPPKSDG